MGFTPFRFPLYYTTDFPILFPSAEKNREAVAFSKRGSRVAGEYIHHHNIPLLSKQQKLIV
jgi:hypothetical protein